MPEGETGGIYFILHINHSVERRSEMKKFLVVMLAVMAITGLLVASSFAVETDKLVVKDSTGTNTVFHVTDAGTTSGIVGDFGNMVTASRATRAMNLIGDQGVMRIWRIHDTFNPAFELIYSNTSAPDTKIGYWDFFLALDGHLVIRDRGHGDAQRVSILGNGYVGIGTTTPTALLDVNGPAKINGVTYGSSRTLKDNIVDLKKSEALEAIEELNPVKFTYKAYPAESHIGFIAEDVPDLVAKNGRTGIDPMDIVAVLTKVVKEQNKTIEALAAKVERLEKASRF